MYPYFPAFLRTTLLITLLMCAPVQAKAATEHCQKMGLFVSVVDLTDILLKAEGHRLPARFDTLVSLVGAIDPRAFREPLRDAGYASRLGNIQIYLNDLKRFILVRQVNGPQFGGWILNKSAFRSNHADMLDLSRVLCTNTVWDKALAFAGKLKGLTKSDDAQSHEPKKLQALSLKTSPSAFSLQSFQKTQMLMRVFLMLAMVIMALYILNFLLKLLMAIRLDRYSCDIPTTLEVGGVEILGQIEAISSRGLSFEVTERSDPMHAHHLTLDRHVRFITDTTEFHGILTKSFDGTAGFRLSVPLKKAGLHQLLALSETKPRRKIEMGRKKKPATPDQVSLALKSHSSPAE